MSNILVVGGTRFLGTQLIPRLLASGDTITVFNRGHDYGFQLPSTVLIIHGDRAKPEDLKKLQQRHYDYIYDMCCFNPDEAKLLLLNISPGAHIIFFSSAAVYETPKIFPLREKSPLGLWPSFGDYGTNKAAAEQVFIEFSLRTGTNLTIFRPTYLLGVNNYFDRENYYFSRVSLGQPILMPGNGKCLIQFGFLNDTAQAFASVPKMQNEQIEILNVAGNDLITLRDFILLCADFVGKQPRIVSFNPPDFKLVEDEFYDDLYPFPNMNFVVSNSRICSRYGQSFTPLDAGLREIYSCWIKNWNGTITLYEQEKKILEAIHNP